MWRIVASDGGNGETQFLTSCAGSDLAVISVMMLVQFGICLNYPPAAVHRVPKGVKTNPCHMFRHIFTNRIICFG